MRGLILGHRNDSYLLEVAILRQTVARRKKTFSTTDSSRKPVATRKPEKIRCLMVVVGSFLQFMFINPHSVPGIVPGTGINTKTSYPHINI